MRMLKRLTAVGLVLAAVLLSVVPVRADVRDSPVVTQQLNFVYRTAARFNSFRDSSVATQKASYAALSVFDTTESFDLRGAHYREWNGVPPLHILPSAASAGRWSIIDTSYAFSVFWGEANNTARAGADSVLLVTQVSPDNVTWSLDSLGTVINSIDGSVLGSLTSNPLASVHLFTTRRGIGAGPINWDRPQANFVRFILREDPNAPAGTQYAVMVTAKRLGSNVPTGFR